MKKYFMAGTDDELQFGDMIELNLTKEMQNGKTKHKHIECIFSPLLVDTLLDQEVIEEREVEGDEDLLDFDDTDEDAQYDELLEAQENLEKRMDDLEERVTKFIAKTTKDISDCLNEIKQFLSPQKTQKTQKTQKPQKSQN